MTTTDAGAAPDRALLDGLAASPNALAPHYRRFAVADRLLLTGHSHQAWPDVAREGLVAAFDDAAEAVDDKWERAFAQADRVRDGLRVWFDEPRAEIALAESTHELLVRLLSGLDLGGARPRLVASDGEFHSLRRQLDRFAEAGIEVVRVPAEPVDSLAARMAKAVDDRTAAALVSTVLFGSARIVPDLERARRGVPAPRRRDRARRLPLARRHGAAGPRPGRGRRLGGRRRLQVPAVRRGQRLHAPARRTPTAMRPVVTGWFAEFGELTVGDRPDRVDYADGAQRFAGATYDPSSNYRAARVARFFADEGLTPAVLHASYRHQRAVLTAAFDALDLPDDVVTRDRHTPARSFAGFLALRSPSAGRLRELLRSRGVMTDSRGEILRLGPAPYLSDAQIQAAVAALGEAARELRG